LKKYKETVIIILCVHIYDALFCLDGPPTSKF